MSKGIIFDIKELTVHDGPGVRVTVFFKGCPLRCSWCHNPEGLSTEPELFTSKGSARMIGEVIDAADLAERLKKYKNILAKTNGGITISGGEPLMQPDFLLSVLSELNPMHRVLQTSGYGAPDVFVKAVHAVDLVLFDIKLTNAAMHQKYTGVDQGLILENFEILKQSRRKFIVRLPMIPGINDNEMHYRSVATMLSEVRDRVEIEILPYNPYAGAKYSAVNRFFQPEYSESETNPYPVEEFTKAGLLWKIL